MCSLMLEAWPKMESSSVFPPSAGDAGDMCWIPGLGRSPGGGNSNPSQYSCLENSMDRGD